MTARPAGGADARLRSTTHTPLQRRARGALCARSLIACAAASLLLLTPTPSSAAPDTATATIATAAMTGTTAPALGPTPLERDPARRALLPELGAVPAELEADVLRAEPLLGTYVAEGHVVLRRAGLTVFADRLFLDRPLGAVIAEGNVVAVEGPAVLACERIVLQVPDLEGVIERARLRVVRGRAPSSSREAALGEGTDLMRLTAEHLARTGPRQLSLRDADFTPCRCAEGTPPDWKLGASSADVDVDSGAWLYGPVLYVRDVPVLALPVLYVPLGERRTGLLLPRGQYTTTQGLSLTLPLFITLGRSWDATLDLTGWLARGPAPGLELRWAPTPRHRGELRATVLFDFGEQVDGSWSPSASEPRPRFALTGRHRGTIDDTPVAADLNLAGDLDFVREFGSELLERQVEESVSRVTVASSTADHLRVAAGLSLRQDLRVDDYPGGVDRRTIGLLDPDHGIRYRFAELRIDALPYPLLDHALSPIARARLVADATGPLDDVRAVAARADLRPSVSLPLATHGLTLVPELALRLAARSGGADGESEGRIAALGRTTAAVELHHRGEALTHVLRPRVTHLWLALLAGEQRAPGPLDDELSLLGPAHQLDLALENEVFLRGRSARVAALDVHFPRDLDGDAPARASLAVIRAELDAPLSAVTLGATARVELDLDPLDLPEWRVSARAARSGLGSASLTYAAFSDRPPLATLLGGEELVYSGAVPLPDRWSAFRGLVASVSATPIAALRLDASAFVDLDALAPLRLLRGGVSWTSPCECWSARLVVEKSSDRDIPSVRFDLELAQVGGTGF